MKDRYKITPREGEIFALLCEGLNPFQVADRLCISVKTVRAHVRNLFILYDVHSMHELVVFAYRAGLVEGFGKIVGDVEGLQGR